MQGTKTFQIHMPPMLARLLSVVAIASLAVGYLGGALVGDIKGPADLGLHLLRLLGLVCTLLLFLSNYGQLSQRKEAELDEREAQLRNRAYVLTHQIPAAQPRPATGSSFRLPVIRPSSFSPLPSTSTVRCAFRIASNCASIPA